MHDTIKIHGSSVRAKQLVDVYNSDQHEPYPWSVISDQVMGGVSSAIQHQEELDILPALKGREDVKENLEAVRSTLTERTK